MNILIENIKIRHCEICMKETNIKYVRIKGDKIESGLIVFCICDECLKQLKEKL